MYCVSDICHVCLKKKNQPIKNINSSLSENKDIIHIIGYLPINLAWLKTDQIILICDECCLRFRETYQFFEMCRRNSALLESYKYKDILKSTSVSDTENEAELTVTLELNNKHEVTSEIKSDSFVKEEDTWKREDADDKEEHPMDTDPTEYTNKELNSEISNTHITVTDSVSSEFTCKKVRAKNKKKLNAAAKKSYTCSTCSKSFNWKIDLERHERVHTGEKPFECTVCGKCFGRKFHLKVHMRLHTGEKPFQCSQCDQCYPQQTHLAYHMSKHTGAYKYVYTMQL